MGERIISQRVVSRRVIGSANPIARKFREFKGSCAGIVAAPIFALIAFGLLFFSEKMDKDSVVVENLELQTASEVTADSGMMKITDKSTVTSAVTAPNVGQVLYYTYSKQEYKQVEKTETETVTKYEFGEEVEEQVETTKLVDEWVDSETKTEWAQFKLGNITIVPSGASLKIDTSRKEYYLSYADALLGKTQYAEISATITPQIGDKRLVVNYLPTDTQLLVVGELSGGKINGGEAFIITTKSDTQLLEDLKTEETAQYWIMKFFSWLLLTLAFLAMLGPILSLADFIPIAGKAASCVAFVVGGIISFIIVLAGTLIIKFWYICLGGMVVGLIAGIVLVIMLIMKKAGKGGEEGAPKETSSETVEAAKTT